VNKSERTYSDIVPDNLKPGVAIANRYDLDININYQHLSEHYSDLSPIN
jgi:hypothetical protein